MQARRGWINSQGKSTLPRKEGNDESAHISSKCVKRCTSIFERVFLQPIHIFEGQKLALHSQSCSPFRVLSLLTGFLHLHIDLFIYLYIIDTFHTWANIYSIINYELFFGCFLHNLLIYMPILEGKGNVGELGLGQAADPLNNGSNWKATKKKRYGSLREKGENNVL